MNPYSKPRPLFFTPRSPWGRLPLKRAHQSHMRASESKNADQLKTRADAEADVARYMAENNVSSSLNPAGEIPGSAPLDKTGVPLRVQSQISPHRAQEITSPSPQPSLSGRPTPSLADMAYLKQQTTPAKTGSGEFRPPAKLQSPQMPSPSEADKLWQKAPEENPLKNPLQFKGWEFIPSLNSHGGGLQLRKNL